MEKIVVLGGGIGGYYVTRELMKRLNYGEAGVLLVDARPDLEYQPFLAEVASGAIRPASVRVPFCPNILGAGFLQATVTGINAAEKTVSVIRADGGGTKVSYDQLVVALGCRTYYPPIPGIAEGALGLKSVEDAELIRRGLVRNVADAARLPKGSPERARLLTFVVVGAGFSGVELFSELLWAAPRLARKVGIAENEFSFHLIDAADHIIADLPIEHSRKVIKKLESRGAHVHLETTCDSLLNGVVATSRKGLYPVGIVVWAACLAPALCLKNSDLPLTLDGRLCCLADMRATSGSGIVEGVWGVGDCCRIPDETGDGRPDGSCAPTAQHAMRQAKCLAGNVVASLRGEDLADYCHRNAGMVGGFGPGHGVFASGAKKLVFHGFPAWLCHRFYHGMAMPTIAAKRRIFADYFDRRNLALPRVQAGTSPAADDRSELGYGQKIAVGPNR